MHKSGMSLNRKIKIALSAALTVAVMVTIFIFSSQPGGVSSGASNGVGAWVLGILGIEIPPGQTASDVVIFAGLKIRNLAHIFLYTCLGFSSYLLSASLWGIKAELRPSRMLFSALCAFGFSLLYACTDEFHQYFVSGRSATVRDIGIDCIGITLAVVVCAAAELIIYFAKTRRAAKTH